ncbi:MAG TPA: DUF2851 family protein [Chitinophagaceae bacterium]|jgi:hypothetical protein
MTERLLQFIWQFQYFNRVSLQAQSGEALQIIHPGRLNTNQGPDFSEARIRIDGTLLAGNIELHVQSSAWNRHGHGQDANYSNIILHVVWEDDEPNNQQAPVLVLQQRVSKLLLQQYTDWMRKPSFVPCAGTVATVKELVWEGWKDRLLAERLQRKSDYVLRLLALNNNHWEEAFWQLLARNFGIQVNADAFEAIARSLPLTLLAKHRSQPLQLEALLLGQAGLLDGEYREEHAQLLQREYHFLQYKYQLKEVDEPVHFLRMRPAAFPTVRLAQLAVLVQQSLHLFSAMKEMATVNEAAVLLQVTAGDYWTHHYHLDDPGERREKRLGTDMVHNILINTIAPVLFAYGLYHDEQLYKDKALQWLAGIRPEKNAITRGWEQLHIGSSRARDSQALIELKTQYCDQKRCLDCSVGNALLKKTAG